MLFENVDRAQLSAMGDVRRPSIADLFVAVMSNNASKPERMDVRIQEKKGALR
jgi:hypothetical protein